MGIFSDWCSSVASAVVSTAKRVASKVIHFVADNAEKFVGTVKSVWKQVKPLVQKAQAPLKALAAATAHIPGVNVVTRAISTGVDALLALENSPALKAIGHTIENIGKRAKALQEKIRNGEVSWLTPEEYEQAIGNRDSLRSVEGQAANLSTEQQSSLEFADAINNLGIARIDLQRAIDAEPTSYDHYLRLRATQKLLNIEESKLLEAGSLDALNRDDYFVIRIASDLIKATPEMAEAAAKRIDAILNERYGKTLQSFVYEELVAVWVKQAETLANDVKSIQANRNAKVPNMKRLQNAKRIQGELDSVEAAELAELERTLPELDRELDAVSTRQRDAERYADAAEGFLQVLEKTPEQLEAEGRSYVIDEGPRVGELIIRAAQKEVPFNQLPEEDQETITDFANIFREDAQSRMNNILEVAA